MARESAYRVAIANANVPNMLGQISTAMAQAGLNIHNMVNKSRGEMAYTLVDVDSAGRRSRCWTACAPSTACCRCATCRGGLSRAAWPGSGARSPAPRPSPPRRPHRLQRAGRGARPLDRRVAAAGAGRRAAGLWFARSPAPAGPAPAQRCPPALPPASYVENTQCLGCHQAAGEAWAPSHHAKAMAPPTEQTVRGNFDNTQFRHQGVTTRFFRRGDKYIVHTDGPDGRMADFEVGLHLRPSSRCSST